MAVPWVAAFMGLVHLSAPTDMSREALLASLPLIGGVSGYLFTMFILYRIVRVGTRGVYWVFPTIQANSKSSRRKTRRTA
jgi:hypothetical protein